MRIRRSSAWCLLALASITCARSGGGARFHGAPSGPGGDEVVDKSRPAREVYRNIRIFTRDDVSAESFDDLMEQISRDLGVPCAYCHEPGALDKGHLGRRKRLARETIPVMWKLVLGINTTYFPGEGGPVRCWTCHRGSPAPARRPPPTAVPPRRPRSDPFTAPDVGSNLHVLKGRSPDELRDIMGLMTESLGVSCRDCHVIGDYASDGKPAKLLARGMLAMTAWIDSSYFEPGRGPTCWTCHRGSFDVPDEPASEEAGQPVLPFDDQPTDP